MGWGAEVHSQDYLTSKETRILGMEEESLVEQEVDGFDCAVPTILCGTVVDDVWVQVTTAAVNLVDAATRKRVDRWDASGPISLASANGHQLALSSAAGRLLLFDLSARKVKLIKCLPQPSPS
jgi:hypothetical protein